MTDTHPSVAELEARIRELETANAQLREASTPTAGLSGRRPRRLGRTITAVVLIVLGALVTPIEIVGGWSKKLLTDTDSFAATYARLARPPASVKRRPQRPATCGPARTVAFTGTGTR